MIVRWLVRAGVVLLVAGSAVQAAAQAVPIRYKWAQGDVLTYRTVVRTTSSATGGPRGPETFEQTMSQTIKLTVAAVNPADGSATLRHSIDAVSMEVTTPAGKVVYDSARPLPEGADPRVLAMSKTLGGMVGEAVSVTMAPTGAVRRIDGAARIAQKLIDDLPRDPMSGALAQSIKGMLSDEALRAALEQSFARLPEQPVNVGDSWSAEQAVGADATGRLLGKSTYTLKAIDGAGDAAVARIAVSLALRQEEVPSTGASTVVKLAPGSKGEGELVFSLARGRIESNTMRTDMPSTITLRTPDAGTITMQNNTRTTMTMTIVK
ncbi:MAG TPA: DUF6263 family protein [Vicinamibacterales bacterium]|nr:DUF6263 family protein [Vicinamibacterales bacterium]